VASLLLGLAGRKGRQTMEEPGALPLLPGEAAIGELFVTTRDLRIRGFQWVGTGWEGQLVLTSYRLFYCFYDRRSIAFAIEPWDVSVELKPASFLSIQPRLVITAKLAGDAAPRRLTFAVPKSASVTGAGKVFVYANPSTAEQFHAWLQQWLASGGASDGVIRGHILAHRRQLFEAELAAQTRDSLLKISLALPLALCTGIAPIFGFLALREARRFHARAAVEQVAVPGRVAWIARLGIAWIVIGSLLWAIIFYSLAFGPIFKG